VAALQGPSNEIIWLAASDPDQAWGKGLPHTENRSFLGVPGTAVALCAGVPVAVFERGSGALRVFEENKLGEALEKFVSLYHKRRLFPEAKRVTVKQYPENAADALAKAGFSRQMQDFVLYQGMM
jgi:ATP-dependent Lhr-like helicase